SAGPSVAISSARIRTHRWLASDSAELSAVAAPWRGGGVEVRDMRAPLSRGCAVHRREGGRARRPWGWKPGAECHPLPEAAALSAPRAPLVAGRASSHDRAPRRPGRVRLLLAGATVSRATSHGFTAVTALAYAARHEHTHRARRASHAAIRPQSRRRRRLH